MTLDYIKNYLKIDYDDDDILLADLIEETQIYIDGCVGISYKTDTNAIKLAELLQKKLICDAYENRTSKILEQQRRDILVDTILEKLSLYEVTTT